jgi:hypothetical protein
MSTIKRASFAKTLVGLAVLAAGSLTLYAQVPKGWYMAGSKPAEYESSVDNSNALGGQPSACLRSKRPQVETGFGTLMQNFSAERYLGKRVRFSAFVKSENIQSWAGLWMRVDGKAGQTPLAFDNMQDRPVKGTSAWRNYEVVLDVPAGATGIYLGILLDGPGTVWMNGVRFEEVPADISTTDRIKAPPQPQGPTNLGFDE